MNHKRRTLNGAAKWWSKSTPFVRDGGVLPRQCSLCDAPLEPTDDDALCCVQCHEAMASELEPVLAIREGDKS